jgi:capsid protein
MAILDSGGVPVPAAAIERIRLSAMLAQGRYGGEGQTPFAYDSAEIGSQELGSWLPALRSPDHEINRDRNRMVGRSRDLVRNDGWGTGATNRIVDNAIGAQFRLSANPDFLALRTFDKAFDAVWADEFSQSVEAGWRLWSDDPARYCDATRAHICPSWSANMGHVRRRRFASSTPTGCPIRSRRSTRTRFAAVLN